MSFRGNWVSQILASGGVPPSGPAGGKLTGTYPNPGVVPATETQDGIIEIATQAEVDAGTDDTRAVTPLKLANATGLIPHANLTNLVAPADDHTQYFQNPGRATGQTSYGGTGINEEWVQFGSTHAGLGRIRFRSPLEIGLTAGAGVEAGDQVALRYRPTYTTGGGYNGGVLSSAATVTYDNPFFVWASWSESLLLRANTTPGFAAYTVVNCVPIIENLGNFDLVNALVLNVGLTHRRVTSGTSSVTNVTGVSFAPKLQTTVSGAVMSRTNSYGLQVNPTYSTVGGSTVNLGTICGVRCDGPSLAFLGTDGGIENLTAYYGLCFENITFPSSGDKAAILNNMTDAADRYCILSPGGARSDWGGGFHFSCGDIEIDSDNLALILGAGNDIRINWNGADLEYDPLSGDDLRWTFGSNFHTLQSSNFTTDSELRLGFDRFAFGQTTAVGNQIGVFVAPAVTATTGGEWIDYLLSQGGNLVPNAALTNVAAWRINNRAVTAGTGSITDITTLDVNGMTTSGIGSATTSALKVTGRQVLKGTFNLEPITAAQLTADANNYTGMGTGSLQRAVLRVSSDAERTITGFDIDAANVRENDTIFIVNVGSNDVVLAHQDIGSDAENRIISPTGDDFTLEPEASALLWYDDTTDRWRLLYASGATTAPAGPTYTPTNVTTDRAYDADSTTADELADVLGTLITDLQNKGILS